MNPNIYVFLIIVFFFFITKNLVSSDKSYFKTEKIQGTTTLTLSFFASGMGLWILTSPAEVGWYGLGFDVLGYAISAATPFLLLYFFGPKIANLITEGTTLPEFLRSKFGIGAQKLVSGLASVYMFTFLIAELASIYIVFPVLYPEFGIEVVVLIAFGSLLYLFKSGFKASLITDRIQGVAIVGLLSYLIFTLLKSYEYSEIMDNASLGGFNEFTFFSFKSALAVIIAVTGAEIFSQGYWQRTFSAKNSSVIKKSSIFAGLLCFVTVYFLGFFGTVGAGMGLENPSLSFVKQFEFDPVFSSIFLILATLLVLSSVDTLQNAIAATLTIDIFESNKKTGQLLTIILTTAAVFFSTRVENIFTLFLLADLFTALIVVPTFFQFKKSLTSKSFLIIFVLGAVSTFFYRFLFVDVEVNLGGLFIPTDIYGLADLNTFLVAITSTLIGCLIFDRIKK